MRTGMLVTELGLFCGKISMPRERINFLVVGEQPVRVFKHAAIILGDSLKTILVNPIDFTFDEKASLIEFERGGTLAKVFTNETLTPMLDNFSYTYPIEPKILDTFVQYNVLSRRSINNVLTCPSCGALPSVHPGCPNCGSHDTSKDLLYHHFACGHVDRKEAFVDEKTGVVSCQKCSKTNLIINVDYDITTGLRFCNNCDWRGNGLSLVGDCLACETSFLMAEAKPFEIWEYRLCSETLSTGYQGLALVS